jgi:beta-glucosidase
MKQPDENVVTVLQGIREAAPSGSEIDYLDTGDGFRIPEDILAEVTRRAAQAACCVAAVGGDSLRFSENRTCGENQGRSDIGLFGNQVELVKAAAAAGKPVIAVLINGRPLSIPWIKDNIPAIIEAWEPGMYGGRAIGEIIFGKVNPSGRLPVTIPRSAGHITQIYNHKPSAYFKQYVDGETDPLFEFGRGLSYTVFTYSNLTLPETIKTGEPADICIDVENTGKMAGDETVLVFLRDLYASVTTPVKKLAAFTRIHLKPGEKQTVHLTIPAEQMGLFNGEMEFVIEPGEFRVSVGGIEGVFRAV